MVFSNNLLLGAVSAAAGGYLIEQSLLFDGSSYLTRTPSVAGNRKTWTFSCWFKFSLTALHLMLPASVKKTPMGIGIRLPTQAATAPTAACMILRIAHGLGRMCRALTIRRHSPLLLLPQQLG
jgi:hypothetical protein